MLVHNALSFGNLALASAAILLHDFAQVVAMVDVDVVKFSGVGSYIPRHAQVHQKQCAIPPCRHRSLEDLAPQKRFFHADRGHYDIRRLQRRIPFSPADNLSLESLCQLFRPVARPVHHIKLRDTAIPQLRNHLLADRSRAQYQRLALVQFSKNPLRQFHACGSHGHRPCAKFCFCPHPLPDFQCALKQAIEHWPCRSVLVREPIRFPHLAQNLRFAQQHGVEPRRNSKKMPHRFVIVVVIERHA